MNRLAAAGEVWSGAISKEQPAKRTLGDSKTIKRLKNQYYLPIVAFQSMAAPLGLTHDDAGRRLNVHIVKPKRPAAIGVFARIRRPDEPGLGQAPPGQFATNTCGKKTCDIIPKNSIPACGTRLQWTVVRVGLVSFCSGRPSGKPQSCFGRQNGLIILPCTHVFAARLSPPVAR